MEQLEMIAKALNTSPSALLDDLDAETVDYLKGEGIKDIAQPSQVRRSSSSLADERGPDDKGLRLSF